MNILDLISKIQTLPDSGEEVELISRNVDKLTEVIGTDSILALTLEDMAMIFDVLNNYVKIENENKRQIQLSVVKTKILKLREYVDPASMELMYV